MMTKPFALSLVLAVTLLLLRPVPGEAWSRKGHVLITRSTVKLLLEDPTCPEALRTVLLEGLGHPEKIESLDDFVLTEPYSTMSQPLEPGLDLFSFRPDDLTVTRSAVPAFNSTENPMHYLNLERFHPDPERRKFAPDGSNAAKAAELPRDWRDERYATAGLLTFRVEQVYENLVQSLAAGHSNEQSFLWMGFLSHYVSDAFQPFHATLNYDGSQCPANLKRDKPARQNLHFELEDRIFSDESPAVRALVPDFWRQFKSTVSGAAARPAERLDPYVATQEALSASYGWLAFLCRAAAVALQGPEFNRQAWLSYAEEAGGRRLSVAQLQGERMALAALAIRTLIRQAWDDATRPAPVSPKPKP